MQWSIESRKLSIPLALMDSLQRDEYGKKKLESFGAGFNPNEIPELIILPVNGITGNGVPNVDAFANVDGSLNLTVIDDANSSTFNPGDRYTVFYSSSITGVDFVEDYPLSLSSSSAWNEVSGGKMFIKPQRDNHWVVSKIFRSSYSYCHMYK